MNAPTQAEQFSKLKKGMTSEGFMIHCKNIKSI